MSDFFNALLAAKIAGGGDITEQLVAGTNIVIEETAEGKAKISASGEVSSEDTYAREEIQGILDGTTLDSFGDVETALADKVDKVSGKGLSSNDFTNEYKDKVDNSLSTTTAAETYQPKGDYATTSDISDMATETWVVQQGFLTSADEVPEVTSADDGKVLKASYSGGTGTYSWQTGGGSGGTTDYSDLTNKPSINSTTLSGNKTSSDLGLQSTIDSSHKLSADLIDDTSSTNKFNVQADWNQTTDTASDYIKNKPTIPAAQVNSDWNASSGVSQILNKPTLGTAAAAATTDFATSAQGTKADSAVQSIKVNGSALTPDANKAVDITAIPASIVSAGALASGMTATTQLTSDDSTKLATTAFVHDVVDALPSPMVFKGTLGSTGATISALPIDGSAEVGDTYKVVTDGTYVVEIDGSETYTQDAKRGDIFICRIKETSSNTWIYIPSGDEPSGTVTNVAVANGGGLSVSGSPVTSSGTITIGHSNSVTAKTSSSLKKFTYDAYGHVTGSSELSTAESNALASGIDSTKVAQISTNQTNIGKVQTQANWNTNNGVKNLLDVTYNTYTNNECSYVKNADGSITLTISSTVAAQRQLNLTDKIDNIYDGMIINGSPTGYATGDIAYLITGLKADGTYQNEQFSYNGTETTINRETPKIMFAIIIKSGVTARTVTLYPMVREVGDSTYEPYALPNTKITPELIDLVDSGAKNLYNPSNTLTSASGLTGTITRNSDGSYTINGTTSGTVYYNMGSWIVPEDGYYILSGGSAAESASQLIYDDHDWQTYESGEKKKLAYWTKGSTHNLYIKLGANITLSNVTFYPMICSKAAWDVSQKYVPYGMSNAELTAKKQDKTSLKYDSFTIGTTYENPTGMLWTVPAKTIVRLSASIHGDGTNYPGGILITFSTSAAYANPENVLAKYEPTGNELNLTISTIYPRPADTPYTLWLYVKGKASAEYKITYTMDILDTFE